MQVDKEVQKEQPKERSLTREQRRIKDRIELEAKQTFERMSERYMQLFMDSDDPEGQDLADKFDKMDRQWRVFCQRRQLVTSAKEMFGHYAASLLNEYKAEKVVENGDQIQG